MKVGGGRARSRFFCGGGAGGGAGSICCVFWVHLRCVCCGGAGGGGRASVRGGERVAASVQGVGGRARHTNIFASVLWGVVGFGARGKG